MERREFLRKSLLLGGTALGASLLGDRLLPVYSALPSSGVKTLPVAIADTAGGYYTPNKAPLAPSPFLKLPVGAVKPKGWLKHQLDLQVGGLCGRYPEVSEYLNYDGNGWVTPGATSGWEEVTYWIRGFAPMAYISGDPAAKELANKWITGMIASQQPDGWFGPANARTLLGGDPDFWPHMPALFAIRSYYEHTSDQRVIPFLTNYFKFQATQKPEAFGKSWAGVRWGDNIDSVYWLYNRTGDSFLIDLVQKIHANSADWTNGQPSLHNVNVAQGFREPAQFGAIGGDPKFVAASERQYANVMGRFGQMAGGGFAGDEVARDGYGDPRQGFETCGIVEYMLSFEILARQTGNPLWLDRCEELAFNSLPAAFDPEQRVTHYVTSANVIQLDDIAKTQGQFCNNFAMQAYKPGVHLYRCCPHNYGMGWPYYIENLWHATFDKGLAANLYAASDVTAKVGDGTDVTISQTTEYPFGDTVTLKLDSRKAVAFPLYLRIPGWCDAATVRVNGQPVAAQPAAQSYIVIDRTWNNGDVVDLHLPMPVKTKKWAKNQNSVTVSRGPIEFSLDISEKWDRYAGTERWPELAVYAQSPWNYGLVLDDTNPAHSFDVALKGGPVAPNPFTHETVPFSLRAKAKRILNWRADSENVITTLQPSPIRSSEAVETVSLIPMGAARLRITSFPTIGDGPSAREWVVPVNVLATASHVSDSIAAVTLLTDPSASFDLATPRFTWWDHKGSAEWLQLHFETPQHVSTALVYWFDDTGHGECRVPKSWRLSYKAGADWTPVNALTAYGTDTDKYNSVKFDTVTATDFRVDVQLQDGVSGGVLRWRLAK